jgi:hypothetical protein
MYLHLNEQQEQFLKELFNESNLHTFSKNEKAKEFIEQIKAKISKKEIDVNKKLLSAHFVDKDGKELSFYPRKDNGALILKGNQTNYGKKFNGKFIFDWDFATLIQITNYLHEYAKFTGDDQYQVYQKSYNDEFIDFKDGVGRKIAINSSRIWFISNIENGKYDDWSFLLPNRVQESLKMMVAYVFLNKDVEAHFDEIHPDIQNLYGEWFKEHTGDKK